MTTISQHNNFQCKRKALAWVLVSLAFVGLSCSDNSEHKISELDSFNKPEAQKQIIHYGQKMSLLGSYSQSHLRRLLDMEKTAESEPKKYGSCNRLQVQINNDTKLKFTLEWFKTGCNMGVGRDYFYLEGYEIFEYEYKNSELIKAHYQSRNLKIKTPSLVIELQFSGSLEFEANSTLASGLLTVRNFNYRQNFFITKENISVATPEIKTSYDQTEMSLSSESQGYYDPATEELRLTKLEGQLEYERFRRNSLNRKLYLSQHHLNLQNSRQGYDSGAEPSVLELNACGSLNGHLEYELNYNKKSIQSDFSIHNNEGITYQKTPHTYDAIVCKNKEPFFFSSLVKSLNRLFSYQTGTVK